MTDAALATTETEETMPSHDSRELSSHPGKNLEDFVTFTIGDQMFGIPVLRVQDILTPANHAQVIKEMWEKPASDTWPRIGCETLIVPSGPMPERANTEFADIRRRMVEAAAEAIDNVQVTWIPETVHDIGYHKPKELADIIQDFL